MEWRFRTSEAEKISLHDHNITERIFEEDITLIFGNGFDICKECELNQTGRHKQTGKAAVILKKGRFFSGKLLDQDVKAISQDELLNWRLVVLSFERLPDSMIFEFDAVEENGKFAGICEVEFTCGDVLFCWNEFTGDAWFQDWQK